MTDITVKNAFDEIKGIVQRTTQNLVRFIGMTGRPGAELRHAVGDINAYLAKYVRDGTFAARLLNCFRLATTAGITIDWMDTVLKSLVAEQPKTLAGVLVVENSIVFAIAQEGRILAKTKFVSRDDVEFTMKRMKKWFDITADLAADTMANPNYIQLVQLAGSISRYLADTARPMPRMVKFTVQASMPSLTLSQLFYAEGSRFEELAQENHTVHPAFMQRELKGLSA
jgi:hypothetical protein